MIWDALGSLVDGLDAQQSIHTEMEADFIIVKAVAS